MVLLEARLQALQDLDRLLDGRLHDIDLLEAPRQGRVLLEDAPVFGERGGADALHRARAEGGLQQVARVERAARRRACPDQGVDLVDEEDRVRLVLEVLEHALQALLEITAVLGAGQQGAHVERVDDRIGQDLGHFVLRDAPGESLGDGGLADAGLADQQRVVLAPAAEDLNDTLDLVLAADQRIDLAVAGELVEVLGELVERRALAIALFLLAFGTRARVLARLRGLGRIGLLDAVGDEVDDVEAGHALLVQVVDRVGVLLAEDRDQHVGAGHFLLAAARRLDVHDGPLDDALEAERRLRVDLVGATDGGRVFLDEADQALPQVVEIRRAGPEHLRGRRVVEQRHEQMLDGDEFMTLLARFDERHVQTDFQLLRNHADSIVHCSG